MALFKIDRIEEEKQCDCFEEEDSFFDFLHQQLEEHVEETQESLATFMKGSTLMVDDM